MSLSINKPSQVKKAIASVTQDTEDMAKLNVSINRELLKELKIYAASNNKTIRQIITDYISSLVAKK